MKWSSLLLVVLCGGYLLVLSTYYALAFPAREEWSEQELLSANGVNSNQPSVVADPSGDVHLVWAGHTDPASSCTFDAVMYSQRHNGDWSTPVDILLSPGGRCVSEPALDFDPLSGQLHVVWSDLYTLYHSSAHVSQAARAGSWSRPVGVASENARRPDIAITPSGRIHVAFYRAEPGWDVRATYSDDGGSTWQEPEPIAAAPPDRRIESVELASDQSARLHLVWTEELRAEMLAFPFSRGGFVFYSRSLDRGFTWAAPLLIDGKDDRYEEDYGAGEIAITMQGSNEVHLVWAGAPAGHRWHQWSKDGGESWVGPQLVAPLGVFGGYGLRNFNNGLDIAADSAGRVHFLTSGSDRLTHVVWEEGRWSSLDVMLEYNPVWPRMAVGNGNVIHVVGVTTREERDEIRAAGDASGVEVTVWYMSAVTEAPSLPAKEVAAVTNEYAAQSYNNNLGATLEPMVGNTPETVPFSLERSSPAPAAALFWSAIGGVLVVVMAVALRQRLRH